MPLAVAVVLLNKVDPLGCLIALHDEPDTRKSLHAVYGAMAADGWAEAQGKHDVAALIRDLVAGRHVPRGPRSGRGQSQGP